MQKIFSKAWMILSVRSALNSSWRLLLHTWQPSSGRTLFCSTQAHLSFNSLDCGHHRVCDCQGWRALLFLNSAGPVIMMFKSWGSVQGYGFSGGLVRWDKSEIAQFLNSRRIGILWFFLDNSIKTFLTLFTILIALGLIFQSRSLEFRAIRAI